MSRASGDDIGRIARRLWRKITTGMPALPGQATQNMPLADPLLVGANGMLALQTGSGDIYYGVITDATPIANVYRVQFDGTAVAIPCTVCTMSSMAAVGTRSLVTLQVGTRVVGVVPRHQPYGVILGTIPTVQLSARLQLLQHLRHTTRARVDESDKAPLRMTDSGLIPDFTGGRLYDSTLVGEDGWITSNGTRIFIDPFMVEMGVDESCGITAFLHDQLLRIAGYNLQEFTAGSERIVYNDQEEIHGYTGYAVYPWEQLGQWTRTNPVETHTPQQWQIDSPHLGPWEPKDARLQPYHRHAAWYGYLGQGGKTHVSAPPISPTFGNTYAGGQGGNSDYVGLSDVTTGLDGQMVFASAKGITLVKRPAILSPKRLRTPEQVREEGDNPNGYQFSGAVGNGPDHRVTGELRIPGDNESMCRASGILDMHAYLCNFVTVHPFVYHTKDWRVGDEAALSHTAGETFVVPNFSRLASNQFLDPPEPKRIRIDHRYGEQSYYPNEASIDILPDGGIVIADGSGASIVMAAGTITLSAPGDIMLKAGKDVVSWGGMDVILRARNSVDISATEKDVRLKAEMNMQLLSANGGSGGMLIENRATALTHDYAGKTGEDVVGTGIVLRAVNSQLVGWGGSVYMRSRQGPVILDAEKGTQDVVLYANSFQQYVGQESQLFFGSDGDIHKAVEFTEARTVINSHMHIGGTLTTSDRIIAGGDVLVSNGHIATERAEQMSLFVAPLKDRGLAAAKEAISQNETYASDTLLQRGQTGYQSVLESRFYSEDQAGSDGALRHVQFSFRNTSQYKTAAFVMYEDRWQQLARLSGQTGATWVERPVACTTDPQTYPYPGKDAFTGDALRRQSLTLFRFAGNSGAAVSRGGQELSSAYSEPAYGDADSTSLNSYMVIE